MTPPNPSPPPRDHASTSSNDTGIIKTLLFLRARRVIFPDPMRPFEFPIPFRVLLRKLCAPIQALRLQRRDPPLVPSQTFLRLQQRPQPRRIRIIAPEFRITSRFQVIQPYDFRVARRAAPPPLAAVCAFSPSARRSTPPSLRQSRVARVIPRVIPRVLARVLASSRASSRVGPRSTHLYPSPSPSPSPSTSPSRSRPASRPSRARTTTSRTTSTRVSRRRARRDATCRRFRASPFERRSALCARRRRRRRRRARASTRARADRGIARASRVPSSRARARRACASRRARTRATRARTRRSAGRAVRCRARARRATRTRAMAMD